MRKNILKITFAAALAVVAGVTAYQAQDKEVMSDLALANVEALANGEGGSECRWKRVKDEYGCTVHIVSKVVMEVFVLADL